MDAGFDFVPSLLHPSCRSRLLKFLLDISSVTMILTQFKLYAVKINIHKVSNVFTLFLIHILTFPGVILTFFADPLGPEATGSIW